MVFRPNPNDELIIGDVTYRIAEHPVAPGMAYGQTGRRATVYQLLDDKDYAWALKIFQSQFREPRLVGQAEQIRSYAALLGLKACERSVLTSSRHVDLLRQHLELAYAVLMPWIPGPTWMEISLQKQPLDARQSLAWAQRLTAVLVAIEERGLAHCDLSGPNVILTLDGGVELVDLEEMYGPGFVQPELLPGGSPGYAHRSAPRGLWHARADRFAEGRKAVATRNRMSEGCAMCGWENLPVGRGLREWASKLLVLYRRLICCWRLNSGSKPIWGGRYSIEFSFWDPVLYFTLYL